MADELSAEEIHRLDTTDEMIAERRSDPGRTPRDMHPAMRRIVGNIDVFSLWSGRVACLLLVPMLISIIIEVGGRKGFEYMAAWGMDDLARDIGLGPTLWAYDVSRTLMGVMFMLGAGYALMRGVHIRADFLYRTLPVRWQAGLDLALYLVFFFPAMWMFLGVAWEYFYDAYQSGETSMDTTWAPILWPGRLAMPLGVAFLLIQGVSEALKCVYALHKGRWA